MSLIEIFKSIALTVLIAVALLVRAGPSAAAQLETLTVAGGCFWCVEADFEKVPGVVGAVSGYTGGTTANPTYKQVTRGGTGHYESVQITFDPSKVTRKTLVRMFLRSVDPTDAGGQFCDRGNSYRSAIFVSNRAEKTLAQQEVETAEAELGQTVVTPVLDASTFYKAEPYHQDYYKGKKLVITRFGPKKQSQAYERYRKACGRDARVKQLWGSAAPFAS